MNYYVGPNIRTLFCTHAAYHDNVPYTYMMLQLTASDGNVY